MYGSNVMLNKYVCLLPPLIYFLSYLSYDIIFFFPTAYLCSRLDVESCGVTGARCGRGEENSSSHSLTHEKN